MKKVIIKILSSIIVFVGTLFLSSFIMNRGNVNTTREMNRATLPKIYLSIEGETVNELSGYTSEMDLGLLRDTITPLDENRGITFRVVKYSRLISNINCKVRTVDGSRLIESFDVVQKSEDDYNILAQVTFKDLLEENTEYSLQIYLTFEDGSEAFYHTRIVEADDYCVNEKLSFVREFLDKEMSEETNADLKTYMESNYLGDNTTLQYVNIHSSMKQLAFGDLSVKRITEPIVNIKEIASETGVFTASYVVSLDTVGKAEKYFIDEYFRVKYSNEVMYLLDFERTMEKVQTEDTSLVRTEDLYLGIADEDIGLIESDDGNIIAFTVGNTLYSYNNVENRVARLFSFYDEDNFDVRTTNRDYSIKALSVDEAGNVWFSVSGYMNRGTYEGKVGITLYYFNGITFEIEERFFIESDKSAEIVMRDLSELCFFSKEGIFYIMLDNSIYAIDAESKTTEILVAGLEENKYSVSEDSTMMVWQLGEDVNASESLMLMNLNTKQITEINAPAGQYIKPLAFVGEDFIYGLAYKEDVLKDATGNVTFPMYCVKIQSKFGEILKQYKYDGIFVTKVSVKDALITLERVTKSDSESLSYKTIDNEYISNNQEQSESSNIVNVFTNGSYEKVVRVLLKKEVTTKTVKIAPKEIIYEGDRKLEFEKAESLNTYYYVYYKGQLQKIFTNPANAVNEADVNYGTVVNEKGYYVWYRANRALRNQIMDLSYDDVTGEEKNQLAFCLDSMLDYEGVVRNSEYLLSIGKTVLEILEDGLEDCNVLDLTGCSLDSILYYVNRDIPVLAIADTEDAYLVIGFNQLAVVVLDPEKGWYKLGRNEAEKLFYESGNKFVTYVPNRS